MQWIEANGARFRCRLDRRGSKTVVLVHEMGGTLESFDAVAARLAERWSVLRYDQRGAGGSDPIVAAPITVDAPARDLLALLDALDIDGPVALVGAAVGAGVAVRFAARWPGRVAALALLSPSTGVLPGRYAATLEKIGELERAAASPPAKDEAHTPRRADPASYAATWRMLADMNLDADLAALSCPTLVAAGADDSFRPPDHVAGVAARIAGARFLVLEAGHVMALDAPELTAATLASFLDAVGFS